MGEPLEVAGDAGRAAYDGGEEVWRVPAVSSTKSSTTDYPYRSVHLYFKISSVVDTNIIAGGTSLHSSP